MGQNPGDIKAFYQYQKKTENGEPASYHAIVKTWLVRFNREGLFKSE